MALIAQFHPRYEVNQVLEFIQASEDIKNRTLNYFHKLPPDTQQVHLDAIQFLGLQPRNRPNL